VNPSDYKVLGTGGHQRKNHFSKKNHHYMSSERPYGWPKCNV